MAKNRIFALAIAAAAAMAPVFGPGTAQADGHLTLGQDLRINISCARYSLTGVIWDRPMAVFLDDLRLAGYSPERAHAIAYRICRDDALVGDTEAMAQTMRNILRADPPS